jgi:hypothetical protein
VGKANGSRECAPDDRLRVPTILFVAEMVGTAQCAFAHSTAPSYAGRGRSAPQCVTSGQPPFVERPERFVAGNGGDQLVEIPLALGFLGLLDLEQVHVALDSFVASLLATTIISYLPITF